MPIFGKTSSQAPEKDLPRHDARTTYFGPKVRLNGDLSGEEDVVFDGRLEGRVTLSGAFRVGPEGEVHAEVTAGVVVIGGRVVGNVAAAERVELLPSGVLEGDIRAPKIVIAEGAQFRGRIDMGGRAEGGTAPQPSPDEPR